MVDTQRLSGEVGAPQGIDGSLQAGVTLQSRYQIQGVLGVGGMGSVYLARDMNFPAVRKMVAVKEMMNLSTDPAQREKMIRDFEREANILAELSHPAIPKIFEYFSNRDRAYLVMEYINGKDLEAIVNATADFLPVDLVRKWAIQLCEVLDYLHSHQPEPIIFRDMKPSNVMIDSQANVRLIDFGIAKAFQAGQKGTMIGTEGYSPPEQYRGEASPAGDVYALGSALHHVLTRLDPRMEAPFTFHERPIRQVNPKVPEALEKIVMKALEYNSSLRYKTALEMKDALEKMVAPSASASAQQQAGNPAVRVSDPNSPVRSSQPMPTMGLDGSPETVSAFDDASAVKAIWKFECEDEIRATPVHHKGTIFIGAYDNNLYALNAADGAFKWKFATDGGIVSTPAISPEDNLIIFGSEDNNLYAVDMRTGKISWTFQTGGKIRSSISLGGGHAFFGSDDSKLYAVRLMNGRASWKVDAPAPIRSRPAIGNDRIVVGSESGEVFGYDMTGTLKWRVKTRRAVISSPIVLDDFAYFGSMDNQIYAIDAVNGWVAWRARTDKPVVGSPAIDGKLLYIGSSDNRMYALDIVANGREIWRYETDGQIVSTPAVLNGAVYFGSGDSKVYSLDGKKGKLRWSFKTNGPITSSPCIVDKVVFIGSTDRFLYALNA